MDKIWIKYGSFMHSTFEKIMNGKTQKHKPEKKLFQERVARKVIFHLKNI